MTEVHGALPCSMRHLRQLRTHRMIHSFASLRVANDEVSSIPARGAHVVAVRLGALARSLLALRSLGLGPGLEQLQRGVQVVVAAVQQLQHALLVYVLARRVEERAGGAEERGQSGWIPHATAEPYRLAFHA